MKLLTSLSLVCALVFTAGCSTTSPTPAVPAQSVSFITPADGAVVKNPFLVKFGVSGMAVQPAGTMQPETGHHHLLINADDVATMASIPADAQHLHFGKGQTETTLDLKPGKYKLTMQFGNGMHQAYGPAMSKSINITVE
jgi:hypothetical protein